MGQKVHEKEVQGSREWSRCSDVGDRSPAYACAFVVLKPENAVTRLPEICDAHQVEMARHGQLQQKVFVVYNPKAGREDQADEIRAALTRHFTPPRWMPELDETTGKEDVAEICRAACRRGASLVIAAGGDGTLVGVANGLLNSSVPLGIVPMGTGNYLARGPADARGKLDEAFGGVGGDHVVRHVDALKVGERCFF